MCVVVGSNPTRAALLFPWKFALGVVDSFTLPLVCGLVVGIIMYE